jgi:hypothetical protein
MIERYSFELSIIDGWPNYAIYCLTMFNSDIHQNISNDFQDQRLRELANNFATASNTLSSIHYKHLIRQEPSTHYKYLKYKLKYIKKKNQKKNIS